MTNKIPINAAEPCHVLASTVQIQRDPIHEKEKPYELQYDPGEGFRRSNCKQDFHPVLIQDVRGREHEFTFSKNGFEIVHLETSLPPEDFFDSDRVKSVYYKELETLLLKIFRPRRVEILEHLVSVSGAMRIRSVTKKIRSECATKNSPFRLEVITTIFNQRQSLTLVFKSKLRCHHTSTHNTKQ